MSGRRSACAAFALLVLLATALLARTTPSRASNELAVATLGDVDSTAYPQLTATISVVDREEGRPVLDLKPDSFVLSDDSGPLKVLSIAPVTASDERASTGYVIAIDTSYAMKRLAPDGQSYLDHAKTELHTFIEGLGSNDAVKVIAFNDGVDEDRTGWVYKKDATLTASIDTLEATDNSPTMAAAITRAAALATQAPGDFGRHAVILVTAIDDDRPAPSLDDQAMKDLHVQFVSLGLGAYSESEPVPPFLELLAKQSGGAYWAVLDPQAPADRIKKLFDLTQRAWQVTFAAPGLPDGQPHDATVTVTTEDGSGQTTARYASGPLCAVSCPAFSNLASGDDVTGDRDIEVTLPANTWTSYRLELFRDCTPGAACTAVAESDGHGIKYKLAVAPLSQGPHTLVARVTASDGSRQFVDTATVAFRRSGTSWGGAVAGGVVILAVGGLGGAGTALAIRRRRTTP